MDNNVNNLPGVRSDDGWERGGWRGEEWRVENEISPALIRPQGEFFPRNSAQD
jgi:hypothetical protein